MRRIGVIIFVSLVACGPASARIKNFKDKPLENVRERAAAGLPDAILEMGDRKDFDSKAILEEMASRAVPGERFYEGAPLKGSTVDEKDKYFSNLRSAFYARQVLAKWGDDKYFQELVAGLKSENVFEKKECIKALGYVGNVAAVRYLGPMLADHSRPHTGSPHSAFYPVDWEVALALADILPDKLNEVRVKDPTKKVTLLAPEWREWWSKHKDEYK